MCPPITAVQKLNPPITAVQKLYTPITAVQILNAHVAQSPTFGAVLD